MTYKTNRLVMGAAALIMPALSVTAQAETSFIANSFYDQQHPLSKYGYVEWADTVKKLSNGDLDPQVYTGTVLLAPRASLQGIRDNVVQVAHHAAVYTPSDLPVANAIQELGFNYDDPLAAALAVADFSMNNPTQLKEWKDNGIVYLGAYTTPPYMMFCREPVRNLEELKGKRIRTAGSTVSAWVESAGGVPVNVPSSEMYSGLDRGSLDCATNATNDLIDRSLWEVAPYTTLLPTGMYWSGPEWGFNIGFWQGLNNQQREVFKEAAAISMTRMEVQYVKRAQDALKEAEEKGNHVYQPADDLMASVTGFRNKAINMISVKAHEKYGLNNADETIDAFMMTYEKWQHLLKDVDRTDEEALAELAMKQIYNKLPQNYGLN